MKEPANDNNDLTLKELVLTVRAFVKYLWSKRWWFIIVAVVGLGIGFYKAWTIPVRYTATMTYMVNEDEGGGIGGAGAILSQLGFAGVGSTSEYNLDKIIALSKSRRIIQEVLLDTAIIEGKSDIVGNHLIDILNLQEDWAKSDNPEFIGFYFSTNKIEDFSQAEQRVLKILHKRIVGDEENDGLLTSKFNEVTGILRLSLTCENEEAALKFLDMIYNSLSDFYIKQSTRKQQETLNRLNVKVDSINNKLLSAEYSLARFRDNSLGINQQRDQLKRSRLNREIQVLTIMYAEILKNRETAAFVLENETPFFQIVDEAMGPLRGADRGLYRSMIFWAILLIIPLLAFLFLKRIYDLALE